MRIRRSAARLLGSAHSAPAPPQSDLPPPQPPALQPCSSDAGGGGFTAGGTSSAEAERCELSRSPWELMAQLDPADPKEVEHFMGTYFVSVACRTNWLFQASILAACIKGEEEEEGKEDDMAGDTVDEVFAKRRHKVAKKKTAKRTVMENRGDEKNAWWLKKTTEVQSEEDDFVPARGGELWVCKKNDGQRRFCRRPVSHPDSLCMYHSHPKSELPPASSGASKSASSSKPVRKRRRVNAGEGYLYYAGFGPSLSKRQRSSSSVLESVPAEQKEEALPEEHTAGPAQTDDADHQVASAHVDEPRCNEMAGIAGGDEESSDDAFGCNNEPRVVGVNGNIKRKSPFKKRWRKPVKARSLKSLMS